MNKLGKNITERWGLCLFIVISALSLIGTELSLNKATSFAESYPVEVSGRIVEVALPASSGDDYRRIRLRLNRHTTISLGLSPKRLPAGSSASDLKLGASMTVRGVYSSGKAAQNPGGFSEANWFRSEGISGKLTSVQVSELQPAPAYYSPRHYLYRFRLHALGLLEKSFAPQTSELSSSAGEFQLSSDGIMQALLMGHTGGMTAYTTKALSEAGAYHLLCVSGMHLMFFLLPFRKLSSWASMSFKGQRRLLSAVVFFPALLSGFGHGISRASLLFLLASLDSRVKRRGDKINSLALAGSVLLLLQPFAIRQNGFWMSFLAAGSLKLMSPQAKSKLINDLISSLGVFLILMPLTAKQQQGANLLAPFANIVLIPLATYLTVVGFLILFLNLLFPFLSQQISVLAKLLTHSVLEIWLKLVSVIANCRKTFLCLPQLIYAAIAILWALVLIFLFRSGYFKVALISLLILLFIPFLPMARQDDQKRLDIVFLDVGQGDATLILLPQGQTILIDGGDSGMGYQRILPALRSLGRDHVDLALVTHGHADHAAGILELMTLGRVDCLLLPHLLPSPGSTNEDFVPLAEDNPFDQNNFEWLVCIQDMAAEAEIPVKRVMSGDQITIGEVRFSFIAPDKADLARAEEANNSSLVFYLAYHKHSVLFTADMTEETEERLVREAGLQPADCLHVAHHGSKLTSGEKFLEQVNPLWAVISVGENNLHNHPHPDTLDRLRERNIRTVRLDETSAFFLRLFEADSRIVIWQ